MRSELDYFDGIVVGGGIGALSFFLELVRSNSSYKKKKWAIVFDHELAEPCSLNTTSTVSLSRIDEGVSPLGDLLFKSFHHFKDQVYPYLLAQKDFDFSRCIEKVSKEMLFFSAEEKEKSQRRFVDFKPNSSEVLSRQRTKDCLYRVDNESFVIDPKLLQETLLDFLNTHLDLVVINEFVTEMNCISNEETAYLLKTTKKTYSTSFVLDARGAYQKEMASFFSQTFNQNEVEKRGLKTVAGSYLFFKGDKTPALFFKRSFYLVIDDINFIYRQKSNELILGSTSHESFIRMPRLNELREKYDFIYSLLDEELQKEMPSFDQFICKTGLRSKAKKRTPVLSLVHGQKSYFALSGLYKNAYTSAFYLSAQFFAETI